MEKETKKTIDVENGRNASSNQREIYIFAGGYPFPINEFPAIVATALIVDL